MGSNPAKSLFFTVSALVPASRFLPFVSALTSLSAQCYLRAIAEIDHFLPQVVLDHGLYDRNIKQTRIEAKRNEDLDKGRQREITPLLMCC